MSHPDPEILAVPSAAASVRAASAATGWAIVGASVPGEAHRRQGSPGEDACHGELLIDGTLIVAIADGKAGAPRGSEGAGIAVDVSVAHVRDLILGTAPLPSPAGMLTGAFAAAKAALEREARLAGPPATVRDWATTLTLAVARPHAFWVAQRGDGAVIARRNGAYFPAAIPQGMEGITYYLTDPDGELLIDVEHHAAVDAFALLTDSLLPLALERAANPREPFFDPLYAFAMTVADPLAAREHLRTFLLSERVAAHTDDDRTIVLAARRPAGDGVVPMRGDVSLA